MDSQTVAARSAIEALRSGVPSRHAVAQLGTTQPEIKDRFVDALAAVAAGRSATPLVISANFGSGKSHLLNYLQTIAEQGQFVTSFVVVSPEMPLGNPHVVLKALSEDARAPARVGKALRALTADLQTSSGPFQELRNWAMNADIDDRFRALLAIYEEYRVDEELRAQILDDFEGKPLNLQIIRNRLREMGQAAGYDLKSARNPPLAPARIRLLARLFRACGSKGLVVLFDEVERIAKFSTKQRIAAYQQLGWWRNIAEQEGSAILPIFTMTSGFLQETVTGGTYDELRFAASSVTLEDERDRLALRGIEMLKSHIYLDTPMPEQEAEVRYRIKAIYEQAYDVALPTAPSKRNDVRTSIRSEIRRWITEWDIHRYYPQYAPQMEVEAMHFDTHEIADESLATGEEEEAGE